MIDLFKDSSFKRDAIVACILFLFLAIFVVPGLIDRGFHAWEGQGDAKFYAQCARDLQSGDLRWSEIYPIALEKGKPAKMTWLALAHPLHIAFWSSLGFSPEEATVVAAVFAYMLVILLLFLIGRLAGGHWQFGMVLAALGLLLPDTWRLATTGLSETLSQTFLLSMFFFMALYAKEQNKKHLIGLFIFAFLGLWCRPHNQFLFIASLSLLAVGQVRDRINFILGWIGVVLLWSILKHSLKADDEIAFPYLFSFLVNTPNYPGHAIFLEYRGSFSAGDLWQEKDQLWHKVWVGWALMKQYWTGWLPQSLCLFVLMFIGRARLLAFSGLLVMGACIFFSAMGHLIPRYWEMLEPLSLAVLAVAMFPHWPSMKLRMKQVVLCLMVLCIALASVRTSSPVIASALHHYPLPEKLSSLVLSEGLIASDKPSFLISQIKRPILLLPSSLEDMEMLQMEVEMLQSIVFSPKLSGGEHQNWQTLKDSLPIMGFEQVFKEQGWEVYNRVIGEDE